MLTHSGLPYSFLLNYYCYNCYFILNFLWAFLGLSGASFKIYILFYDYLPEGVLEGLCSLASYAYYCYNYVYILLGDWTIWLIAFEEFEHWSLSIVMTSHSSLWMILSLERSFSLNRSPFKLETLCLFDFGDLFFSSSELS